MQKDGQEGRGLFGCNGPAIDFDMAEFRASMELDNTTGTSALDGTTETPTHENKNATPTLNNATAD